MLIRDTSSYEFSGNRGQHWLHILVRVWGSKNWGWPPSDDPLSYVSSIFSSNTQLLLLRRAWKYCQDICLEPDPTHRAKGISPLQPAGRLPTDDCRLLRVSWLCRYWGGNGNFLIGWHIKEFIFLLFLQTSMSIFNPLCSLACVESLATTLSLS